MSSAVSTASASTASGETEPVVVAAVRSNTPPRHAVTTAAVDADASVHRFDAEHVAPVAGGLDLRAEGGGGRRTPDRVRRTTSPDRPSVSPLALQFGDD